MGKLRLAILGAGNIAQRMAATAVSMPGEVELVAVASREHEKAQDFADRYHIPNVFGSYEAMLMQDNIDLVYVATPHSHHAQHVRMCLEYGKHVLCEKPFTPNEAQARELFDLANQKGLFVMEAFWSRLLPFWKKLYEILDEGNLGPVRSVQADFGGYSCQVPRMNRPELAGGALLDIGVYCLHFAEMVLGREIYSMTSAAQLTPEGVDAQSTAVIQYQSGALAVLSSSMVSPLKNQALIFCEKGYIRLDYFWKAESIQVFVTGKEQPEIYHCPLEDNGFECELRAAAQAIEQGWLECPEISHETTLFVLRQADELRRQWGMKYPFEV